MAGTDPYHSIFMVTGPVQGGKSTFLSTLVELLRKEGKTVEGFLCPGTFSSGRRSGFKLTRIRTGMQVPMASDREKEGWFSYRRFWFNPDAFYQGRKWIESSLEKQPEVLVIDEVGPMELEGSGWSGTLDMLTERKGMVQLWSVREQVLSEVIKHWGIKAGNVIDIERETPLSAMERIRQSMKLKQSKQE